MSHLDVLLCGSQTNSDICICKDSRTQLLNDSIQFIRSCHRRYRWWFLDFSLAIGFIWSANLRNLYFIFRLAETEIQNDSITKNIFVSLLISSIKLQTSTGFYLSMLLRLCPRTCLRTKSTWNCCELQKLRLVFLMKILP